MSNIKASIASLCACLRDNTEPTPNDISTIILWLNSHGYAVAAFTPDECANVDDMDELESRMIEAGNNYIAEQE